MKQIKPSEETETKILKQEDLKFREISEKRWRVICFAFFIKVGDKNGYRGFKMKTIKPSEENNKLCDELGIKVLK